MIIIDVGAHDGNIFSLPYSQDSNNVVYAIEPIPELAEKIRSHNLPNLHVFCMAIGDEEGVFKFHVNKNTQTSSLSSADCTGQWESYAEQLEEVKTIEVPVSRLDLFLEKISVPEVDLLKIDTQGFDFRVLQSAGDYIHCIKRIIVEVQLVPLYEGSSGKEEVVEYLVNKGFRLVSASLQTDGLEENLEFIRINRYSLNSQKSEHFDINLPYVGVLSTPTNDHVGKLLEDGTFEGPEQAFLWLYLQPGDTFFDCGSHVGLFSCIAAKRLENSGKIVGFDPHSVCSSLYSYNLNRIGCNCFTALNIGLSDTHGQAELLLGKPGMSAFSTLAQSLESTTYVGTERVLVEQKPLDDIVASLGIERVDLAKLDVEGWESFVLKGASQSIKAGKFPLWMIEFTEANAIAAGSSTKELRALIESFGYTLCRFDSTHFRLVPEPLRLQYPYENLFAVMDLSSVNNRLKNAEPRLVEIAKDIVAKWDTAVQAMELRYSLEQERYISGELRQRVQGLEKDIFEERRKLQEWQQQAQVEQERTQTQFQQTQTELERTQTQFQQTQTELERTQTQFQQTQTELERTQTQFQQTQTELERTQTQFQQTQTELERTQTQLQQTQTEQERTQTQLQQTQTEQELTQAQFQQTQAEQELTQAQFQQTQAELERTQTQLQQTQAELERTRNRITAMESSKFWQLRIQWFKLKKLLGLPLE